ncbi:hypothetical protein CVT24_003467 [Panaeolus cyanescens]|uniref:Uncharacterized protein n=1 Tax=Panaeolus cyanescens TaxID=181874 RepID=A0A409Y7S5_9AGAR|nr:hypothetical protein CVT24_003467 [Panaeolus cyanescens]
MSQQAEIANSLPGFGQPLKTNAGPLGNLFPTALGFVNSGVSLPLITLRELSMLQFMNAITDKPDWHIKVHDDTIAEKWKAEVSAAGQDFTEQMFEYCMQELRHKASFVPEPPAVPPPIIVYDGNVVKSDNAVTTDVKKELQDAMQKFEDDIPLRLRDWHPFSDEQVLDLVHPSLFPLVYGTTRVLEKGTTTLQDFAQRCGQGKVAPVPSEEELKESAPDYYGFSYRELASKTAYSRKFQWLPCEVDISGQDARITSYINNLHPREKKIYELVEKIIDASIPLWEITLGPLQDKYPEFPPRRVVFDGVEYDPDPENGPETDGPQQLPDEDEDDFWERRQEWIEATRQVVRPEPGDFTPHETPTLNIREKYGKTGLQVIVKFANIVLTPEKPAYDGGSWHVEGQLNEHIVATSLYYYSSENITASSLNFRQQCDTDEAHEMNYEQNHHDWLQTIYGCENEGPAVQEIGGVDTREGRLLTFPNILQHRVGAFKLADPTKPGHRKILALFLVDPNIKIISTAHVPCQRKDWWKEAISQQESLSTNATGLGQLPVELQTHIFDEVEGFPLGMDEAKALRLELMEERKAYIQVQDTAFQQNTFSLCEH